MPMYMYYFWREQSVVTTAKPETGGSYTSFIIEVKIIIKKEKKKNISKSKKCFVFFFLHGKLQMPTFCDNTDF